MPSADFITHLIADTENGVQVVDPVDYTDLDLLPFKEFEEQLSSLSDDELIFTAVDPDQLDELKQSYSVQD